MKNLMSEYIYRLVLGAAIAASPLLQNPLIQSIFTWFMEQYVLPGFIAVGRYYDFVRIDEEAARDNKEFQDSLSEVRDIENTNKPLEEISNEEIKRIRDKVHGALDKLIKMPKDFDANAGKLAVLGVPKELAVAQMGRAKPITRRYIKLMSA